MHMHMTMRRAIWARRDISSKLGCTGRSVNSCFVIAAIDLPHAAVPWRWMTEPAAAG
jgi:hypothetical protein